MTMQTMKRQMAAKVFMMLALLLMGVSGVKAADYVLTYTTGNTTYYLARNGTSGVERVNTFNPTTCIWNCEDASGNASSLYNGNTYGWLYQSVNGTKYYLEGYYNDLTTTKSTGNNNLTRWRTDGTYVYNRYSNSSSYFITLQNGVGRRTSSNQYCARPYQVTSSQNALVNNTTAPDIHIDSASGNTIEFDHGNDIGYYVPANSYTIYTFNYNDHNVYNNTDWGNQVPQGVEITPDNPTYTWSLTANGGGVATINSSTGVVTLSGAPTGDITVRLTVQYNVNTLPDKYSEYTLTYSTHDAGTRANTDITGVTLTPNPCTLDYQGTQTYTITPTATKTTSNFPAYIILQHGSQIYYYYAGTYNGTAIGPLYDGTIAAHNPVRNFQDKISTETTESVPVTCSWSITGSSAATISSTTGNSTTVTYASVLSQNDGAILTVTATAEGETATATATINLNATQPTSITPESSSFSLCIGDNDIPFTYTLSPSGCYDHVTVTTSDATVVEPHSTTAYTGGQINIDAGHTAGTATLTLTAATGVTATVTVNVQPRLTLPMITFDNTTSTVTITSDETGATIYYRTDGGAPDLNENIYTQSGTTPVSFTIPSQANVTAFATKTGYCSNATAFASKIIEQVEKPTLTVGSDGKVTMTSATAGATIYYTIDGTDPTATTGTVYNSPVDLPSGATVKAIAIKDDWLNSNIESTEVIAPAATPTITITDAGSVTIACTTTGATIYYTIDGSTPDPTNVGGTNPTVQYNGTAFTVGNGVTVKAIATKTGYLNSEVASNRYMTASGVSGTTVTINDAEDHLWSYYNDPDCPVRSLSPADVKITYLGDGIVMTGNNNYTASSTDFVKPGETNYTGGAKVNVGGENENTFIYYKTLERGDATQTAWTFSSSNQSSAASRCPYTPIPNPFQVRPTYGTPPTSDRAAWAGWRGFQCWRLKSVTGGAVYSAASDGTALAENAIINAETQIYFAPNSEYGMEVELEAVWSRAYLVYANGNGEWSVPNHADLGYERNFVVLSSAKDFFFNGGGGNNNANIVDINRPSTITPYLPNGTSGNQQIGNVQGVYNYNANNRPITLQANTKFENVKFVNMGGNTLTAGGHDLIVGRGCSGRVNLVRGMDGGSSNALDYTIRMESGEFNNFYMVSSARQTYSSTVSARAVFGCDYDRASNTNSLLKIASNGSGDIYGGTQMTCSSASNKDNLTFDWLIKSGTFHEGLLGSASGGDESIYLGSSQSGSYNLQYIGKRRMIVEGGDLAGIAGGMNSSTANGGSDYNNTTHVTQSTDDYVVIRIKGGNMRSSVYGAAAFAGASGGRKFVFTGGTIAGWVAGGANGTQTDGGTLYGPTNLYIGGKIKIDSNGSTSVINRAVGGNVFGAGCGFGADSNSGQILTYGTTVVVADEAYIERGVYGGGSYGYTTNTSNIYVLGGHVGGKNGGVSGTSYSASIAGGVFGGACQNQGGTVNITMTDGLVEGGIYGGSNATGTLSGNVTMNINGGQVGTKTTDAVIHGGGLGNATRVLGSVNLTLGASTTATDSVTVYGDVYGGSAQGKTNGNNSRTSGAVTNVTLNKGDIHGNLYGGGLGNATYPADVYGPVTVTVNGGSVTLPDQSAGVFGCNNVNGAPQSTVTVLVTGTNDDGIDNIFGGGNHADYPALGGADYPTVTMTGGWVNNSVFGGGNEADIKGNANVTMTGGTVINRVFGGGNLGSVGTYNTTTPSGHTSHSGCIGWPASTGAWTKGGKCTVTISGGKVGKDNQVMPQDFGYVFGASRGDSKDPNIDPDIEYRAYVKETDVTISGTAFIIGGVYGGSENGHVKGDTYVKIQANCQIGCGEGKTTPYTDAQWTAAINAVNNGIAADIIGAADEMPECPHWNYQDPYLMYDPVNAIPGGSTTGYDGHTFYGNVFGGGSGYWPYEKQGGGYEWLKTAGQVEGNTKVEITGGHILTSIYGGNELTNVLGNCEVTMSGGTLGVPRRLKNVTDHPVTCYLFGAGKGDPRTYFNQLTNVANAVVNVTGGTIFGSVFGGGEDGHILGNATVTIGNDDGTGPLIGTWGTSYIDGNIFGGGRGFNGDALTAGVVSGNVVVNIKGGKMLGSIYGGGRLGSVGTYLVPVSDSNYGKLIPEGTQQALGGGTSHGLITVNISGGTIGNTFEYIVPTSNWTQAWKDANNITYTEFGSSGSDENRLMHTKGGNVFAGCMGRLYKLNGQTLITNWPDMGKARQTVLNISGGTIKSNVYGGGELGILEGGAANTNTSTVTITGGTIGTEVYDTTGDTYPYYTFGSVFGGGYGSDRNVTGALRSMVNARDHAGLVTGNTVVTVSDADASPETRIWASVYGGGELARVTGNATVTISGSKTEIGKDRVWNTGDQNMPNWANDQYVRYGNYRMGNVFGGGKGSLDYTAAGQILGNATVTISSGKIYHNVYGGGALGSVGTFTYDANTGNTTCANGTGTTTVTITGGQIGINGYDNGMVNGSSRGLDGDPKGSNLDNVAWVNNSIVNIGNDGDGANFDNPKVFGAVYGGGENGHNYGSSVVNIYSGIVGNPDPAATWKHGHVYGAGCGTDNYTYNGVTYYNPKAGIIHGAATLNIKGGRIVNAAYGGGALGTTEGKATVNVTGGRIGSVYGGPMGKEGAKAENNAKFAYCGVEADVNIDYANTPAADDGSTTQLITGSVYGGGEAGTVEGEVVVNMKKGLVMGDLYGGGALADTNIDNAQYYGQTNETVTSTATHTTTVNLTGGTINGNVYGGALGRKASATETANPAYVYGDVLVELNKTIATDNCVVKGVIHGANNYNGSPKGEVTVHIYKTVDWDGHAKAVGKDDTSYNLKAVYGGGNEAAYIPVANATQTANVIIDGCSLTSIETVYGGGNAASVPGTHVVVNSCYEIGTVFGGGNGKDNLSDGSLNYGAHVGYKPVNYTTDTSLTDEENYAAYQAAFEAQKETLTYGSGESKVDALGGTIHKVFGGSNTRGNVRHESVAFIDESDDSCPLVLGEVYGGGNEAYMEGGSNVKLGCISYLKTLYGGANAADVGGDIELTVTSGRFERVFGGNNQSGTIKGSIKVNIEETGCHPIVIGELYGCGNQAPYRKPSGKLDPEINIKSFTSIGRVFGGGLGETAVVTGSPTVNINEVLGANHNGNVTAGSYTYNVPTYFDADGNFKGWTLTFDGKTVTAPTHTKGKIGAIGTVFGGGNAAPVAGNTAVNIGTEKNDYLAVPAANITVGTTDVSRFYTRGGTEGAYTYTAASGTAVANTTYYEKVVGADIRNNVFGGGNDAEVTGNTDVTIGKKIGN